MPQRKTLSPGKKGGFPLFPLPMMPMIEPEVNIKSETRAECDQILLEEILKSLDALPEGQRSCSS